MSLLHTGLCVKVASQSCSFSLRWAMRGGDSQGALSFFVVDCHQRKCFFCSLLCDTRSVLDEHFCVRICSFFGVGRLLFDGYLVQDQHTLQNKTKTVSPSLLIVHRETGPADAECADKIGKRNWRAPLGDRESTYVCAIFFA